MLQLTDRALQELLRIKKENNLSSETYLRVGVKGGGCAGFTYTLGFDDILPTDNDQVFESNGIKIVVDNKSFLYLNGTELDFQDELMGRGFKFNNPNSKNGCGCGESFGV